MRVWTRPAAAVVLLLGVASPTAVLVEEAQTVIRLVVLEPPARPTQFCLGEITLLDASGGDRAGLISHQHEQRVRSLLIEARWRDREGAVELLRCAAREP